MRPPPPRPTLFPYTTLFRSAPTDAGGQQRSGELDERRTHARRAAPCLPARGQLRSRFVIVASNSRKFFSIEFTGRSEEHTSELQSRPHLVCRLLLEKKK